jgi:hypothetical protein
MALDIEKEGELPVVEHARSDEVDALVEGLRHFAPEGVQVGKVRIVDWDWPVPVGTMHDVVVPVGVLEGRSTAELAFALTYGLLMDPMSRLLDDALETFDGTAAKEIIGMPILGLVAAGPLGAYAGFRAMWRGTTQFPTRERVAIAEAVRWAHRAGFDARAGVTFFKRLEGWFDDWVDRHPTPEPTMAQKAWGKALGLAGEAANAVGFELTDEPFMISAEERAEVVREVCRELGVLQ